MKKLAALVLALVICLAPGAPALAAGAVLIPDPAALMGEYVQSAYYEDYDYAGDEGAKMVSLSVDVAAWDWVRRMICSRCTAHWAVFSSSASSWEM